MSDILVRSLVTVALAPMALFLACCIITVVA